jgi:hypothetical protein
MKTRSRSQADGSLGIKVSIIATTKTVPSFLFHTVLGIDQRLCQGQGVRSATGLCHYDPQRSIDRRVALKVGDKRPQRDVITGDSDDLIHELLLQPRGNTHYHPEDNKDHKG